MPAEVGRDAAGHDAWVLTESGTVAGLAVAVRKSPGGAEIRWIAVDPARRGRGHGTMLLGHVLASLAVTGVSAVEVKTLDRSSGYRPYEATWAFWEHNGFVPGRHYRPAARLAAGQSRSDLCRRTPPDPLARPAQRAPGSCAGHEPLMNATTRSVPGR